MLSMLNMARRPAAAMGLDSETVHALIERGLNSSFWKLDLPGGLERDYQITTLAGRISHTLRSGWLALLIFNSFLLVDWLMARDVFWFSVLVRVVLFTPLCLITLFSSTHYKQRIIDGMLTSFTDWVILISGWGAALCLAVILYESRSPYVHYYHAGFLVVVIYGNLVQQLAFRFAILFSLGVLCVSVTGVMIVPDYPAPIRIAMIELLAVTICFTLTANYLVEKARRRRYLLLRREHTLVEDLSDVNMRLQKLSRSDVLTGVANRRHFHDYLTQVWERARIDRKPMSVLMLDVDHFKAYNDHYGHPEGDECLRQIAKALESSLRRPGDFVARYGGEEFIAVLPEADASVAQLAAERVRQSIERLQMRHEASPTASVVTVSVGVATAVPGMAGVTADKLVSSADRALYDAKHGGRNRVNVIDKA
ncbi:MAG TPA: diguanylate cyclase [Aquabacterium sp.]|uniref:GGDEF domain-containing protein n=1 Tax=Aquabacterium sp. TaxID=1872578 RepID=UPI002E307D7D|nr:diguanylate cyclase [Aquabacterium sp.]HEX5373554.1 diguanylate cyclase [Aquabacterium sp.]